VQAFLGHPAGPADADVDPRQQLPLDVPVWCVHATDDDTVPISQSLDYVAAATAAGAQATMVEVDGDHFVVIDAASEAWRQTLSILDGIG
jgi:pimeloyl-ACP methyl ester carboxylesterase